MKQLMFVTLFTFLSVLVIGQVPGQINYQGIARRSTSTTLSNQDISLRLSIHSVNPKGSIVYQETRNIKTDHFGMFVVAIGSSGATNVLNTIKGIDWADGQDKFLQVEILPKNEKSFIEMGTSKLLSVPYAFAAEKAQPVGKAGGSLSGVYPNPQIGGQVITNFNIADSTITASKIAPGVFSKTNNGPAGGDLKGMYPNPQIADNIIKTQYLIDGSVTNSKIANSAVTSSKLASGVIPTSLPPNGNAGGVLSGNYPNPSLSTNAVTTLNITDGSVTAMKLANGVIPSTLPPNGIAGGDLNGTYPNPGVIKLNGIAIGNTAPVLGQVLKFDGTQWAPSPDILGSFSIPYSSSATSAANLFSITNQGGGSAIEGINSSINSNAFGLLGKIISSTPAPVSAAVRGINNGSGSNGYGIWGTHAGAGSGVYGSSPNGTGVNGFSAGGKGIYGGSTTGTGIFATSNDGVAGLFDISNSNSYSDAVFASNAGYGNGITSIGTYGNGILGIGNDIYGTGILGINNAGGEAILGFTISDIGSAVVGRNDGTYAAVRGFNTSNNGIGILAIANSWGATNGTALIAELEGSNAGNTAIFKANNNNVARIDNTGKGFFNGGTQMGGADIAEYFDVEGDCKKYEPGDVLIISQNSDRMVEKSSTPYSNLIAGVYATKPGVLLTEKNAEQDALELMVPMGVIGVLPTKVCLEGGAIKRGDLLVTSSLTGVAMKADLIKVKVGQVLGKALQSFSENGVGKINVLVSFK